MAPGELAMVNDRDFSTKGAWLYSQLNDIGGSDDVEWLRHGELVLIVSSSSGPCPSARAPGAGFYALVVTSWGCIGWVIERKLKSLV